jgi:hypothetical protein
MSVRSLIRNKQRFPFARFVQSDTGDDPLIVDMVGLKVVRSLLDIVMGCAAVGCRRGWLGGEFSLHQVGYRHDEHAKTPRWPVEDGSPAPVGF